MNTVTLPEEAREGLLPSNVRHFDDNQSRDSAGDVFLSVTIFLQAQMFPGDLITTSLQLLLRTSSCGMAGNWTGTETQSSYQSACFVAADVHESCFTAICWVLFRHMPQRSCMCDERKSSAVPGRLSQ